MRSAILWAGGATCLLVEMIVAADDVSPPAGQAVTTRQCTVAESSDRPGTSPLPTQIWWTENPGTFLVYESGPRRLASVDSTKRPADRPLSGGADSSVLNGAVPAPSGTWSVKIDPRMPVVRFIAGDIRKAGDRAPAPTRVPDAIPVDPNPQGMAVTPDSRKVLVACDTTGPADRRVAIVEVETGKVTYRPIRGSSNLRGIAVDPSGRFALAVHLVHKSHLPSTQIEQGWVFTNALTYLSLEGPEITVSLPLDLRTKGFANPEGVAIAPNGEKAWVAHAGADIVSVIELKSLLAVVQELATNAGATGDRPTARGYTVDDLRLTRRYVRARIPVGANPRATAVSPDGTQVAVANRLDDSVSLIDAATDSVTDTVPLYREGERPPHAEFAVRREGEKLFHSGRLSFSGQFSCASCHPDGHTDGLNWDLPADGFNNFFNTKSLLGNAVTDPYGWLGTSATLRERFTGTLRYLFQHEPTEAEVQALDAYLPQLRLPPSARPPSEAAMAAVARGRTVFDDKGGCRECHSGAKFTDRRRHDIGTGAGEKSEFDTPTLLGISTTAPYLHDGRAATFEEIFAKHNLTSLHGRATDLSPAELADLIEYLKNL